jgi:DNA invertase Pin-like site-specific DNA recombinase
LHPLDPREVWHIAKSVSKWTWRRFDIEASDARFRDIQAHRGRLGGLAKGAANEDKRATARIMRAQGLSLRAIAAELGVHHDTVREWCR